VGFIFVFLTTGYNFDHAIKRGEADHYYIAK